MTPLRATGWLVLGVKVHIFTLSAEGGEAAEATPYVGVGMLGTAGSQTADIAMSAIGVDRIIGGRSTNVKQRAVEVESSR